MSTEKAPIRKERTAADLDRGRKGYCLGEGYAGWENELLLTEAFRQVAKILHRSRQLLVCSTITSSAKSGKSRSTGS